MSEIAVVLTCFNRKEKTLNCIKKLYRQESSHQYHYIIVDDRSTDGTREALLELEYPNLHIIDGNGMLFWNGGMHRGIEAVFSDYSSCDYLLLVNDDVDFIPGIIDEMVEYANLRDSEVVVGATSDTKGKFSYGGILYTNGLHYEMIGPECPETDCTTFNANCTLIPMKVAKKIGNLDPCFKHSMGDFDYGFRISRSKVKIHVFPQYVGTCNDNPKEGTWMDPSLGFKERIRLKESFKGLPAKDWFHFLKKNFGFGTACIRTITPYVKIMLGK